MRNILPAFVLSWLIITILSSCSSTAKENTAKVYTVELESMKFVPAEITVRKGDTVIWINNDFVTHDVTEENKSWTSSAIPSGKSWKMAVEETTDYFCSIHPVMKGKVVVE